MKKHLSLRWFTAFFALIMCVLSMPMFCTHSFHVTLH